MRFARPPFGSAHARGYDGRGPRLRRWLVSIMREDGRTLHTFGTYAATRADVAASYPAAVIISPTRKRD